MPTGAGAGAGHTYPSIKRRLICMVYEALLLAGVAFFAGLLFLGATGTNPSGWTRHAFQVYLFLVIGLYFVGSWRRGGQTLPMKTWKLRLVGKNGARITLRQAILRYLCAWPCLLLGGIGILYAAFDRQRQFLHDRLAGTSVVTGEW
ncbi:MAG: RDD family protein [Betaproteobacteria bacterium]|nr:RDD family protein [Betaproteobacteria bacterium]